MRPEGPVGPAPPVAPVTPDGPVGPVLPVVPVTPEGPLGPIGPGTPFKVGLPVGIFWACKVDTNVAQAIMIDEVKKSSLHIFPQNEKLKKISMSLFELY